MIQVVINLSQYFLKLTSYQHAPKSALLMQGAIISMQLSHGSWWSLLSGTVHFCTPQKAEEEQEEQPGAHLHQGSFMKHNHNASNIHPTLLSASDDSLLLV